MCQVTKAKSRGPPTRSFLPAALRTCQKYKANNTLKQWLQTKIAISRTFTMANQKFKIMMASLAVWRVLLVVNLNMKMHRNLNGIRVWVSRLGLIHSKITGQRLTPSLDIAQCLNLSFLRIQHSLAFLPYQLLQSYLLSYFDIKQ